MSDAETPAKLLTWSNGASFFRVIAAVALVALAAAERETAFLVLLALALVSDLFDGWLARKLGNASEFGSRLDGWCDRVLFLSMLPSLWFLRPEFFRTELVYALIVIGAYAVAVSVSLLKFRIVASYHTWLSKGSVVLIAVSFYILMLFDQPLPWRIVAVGQIVVAAELTAITLRLDKPRSDVPSVWHLLRRA